MAPGPDAAPDLRVRLRLGGGDATRAAPSRASGDPSPTLDRWSADLAARGRFESGLAHPYCGELGKALARAWNPQRVLEGRGVSGYLAQAADNLKSFARVWRRVAEQFAGDGAPAVDADAVAAVRRAAESLPPPPPEALVGTDALVTTWEFEVEVSITPPAPVVGLEFDEVLGVRDIRVPLDRRIWKKVRLVGVG